MVFRRRSTPATCDGIFVILQALAVLTSAAVVVVASLVRDFFQCFDGWGRIVIDSEASGGGISLFALSSSNVKMAIAVTAMAMAGIAIAATLVYSSCRGSLKSPWSGRRRKHTLLAKHWETLFDADGRLLDGGVKFLRKIRTAGVEPSIRADVWPFLLGMYDVKSTKRERSHIRAQKRREYLEFRRQCRQISKCGGKDFKMKAMSENNGKLSSGDIGHVIGSSILDDTSSDRPVPAVITSFSQGDVYTDESKTHFSTSSDFAEREERDDIIPNGNIYEFEMDSLDSYSSDDSDDRKPLIDSMETEDDNKHVDSAPKKLETRPAFYRNEDFATWQKIIRLDAVRADAEWVKYSPSQAAVSEAKAKQLAESVGLKDCNNLEPCRLYHAARLIAILEAYAVYDPEIGYCQGMSDLLSPIVSVIEEDFVAFWCFVAFMRKARHNFRLDEVGIKRQLNIVSKIIRFKDSNLYRHLEKLEAEDCFFVYRMVVVLFRRELTFEQTLSLWEVMWADQAAIRDGMVKSAWVRMRLRAPPTDDLLLYAIAACILQRRKLIIENYSGTDEIMKECSNVAGHLDVWKLLDDAHDLVVTLHNKI